MSLEYLGQQLTLYSGYFTWFTGIFGNGMNIIVFLTMQTYRTTPCTFYFLIGSIDNFLYISIILTTRILAIGYNLDFTRYSLLWCKIRFFLIYSLSSITLTCSSLSTIDQYLITSRNINLRRYSSIKWAHRIILFFIILWFLHAIPTALYRDITPISHICFNNNSGYSVYTTIYLIGLLCLIPVLTMIVFGYLTYRNLNVTRVAVGRRVDYQITRMTLFLLLLNVICLLPYGIVIAYQVITTSIPKDSDRLDKENFALTIVTLVSYYYYSVS